MVRPTLLVWGPLCLVSPKNIIASQSLKGGVGPSPSGGGVTVVEILKKELILAPFEVERRQKKCS